MIVYFANQFPCTVEPYVSDEVCELRRRGIEVIVCSVKQPDGEMRGAAIEGVINLRPLNLFPALHALFFLFDPALRKPLLRLLHGNEPLNRRLRALVHTWIGAYFALQLKNRNVEHIHAHHGFFGSWVAMIAARLLGSGYSITLHGSDLLLHGIYLDEKLANCKRCFTISEFNRNYLLKRYSQTLPSKITVQRMGVEVPQLKNPSAISAKSLRILCVGRLHEVKNHAFLVRSCRMLKDRGNQFTCTIIGSGPERAALEKLICDFRLTKEVTLAGHISREEMDGYYDNSDLVVLTSRSEGIPLTLMEAMARGKIVLAPAITGIPELIASGETGFLYRLGSLRSFVRSVETIARLLPHLNHIGRAARNKVEHDFNSDKTLASFAEQLMRLAGAGEASCEDSLLQQI
jgi:colanic acid/amylovoran biosynthesis glycosyltransferase